MKDKDITWDVVVITKPGHRLFDRYCFLNSCCENCNPRVRFWCQVKDKLICHQEQIIKRSLNKRGTDRKR